LNTINEQSVTAVVANYNTRKVSFTRIGRGNNFEVDLGNAILITYYSITNNLTNVSSSSKETQVAENNQFNTTLTVNYGELKSVVVTMGGVDVTDDVYDTDSGIISISNVTGNIVITAIAEIDIPVTDNVIKTSIASDGTLFADGKGWMANSRIGSGGIYAGNQTPGTESAQWVTGHIEIDPNVDNTFYLKNVNLDKTSTSNNHGIAFFDASFTRVPRSGNDNWDNAAEISISRQAVYDGNIITQFTYMASDIPNKDIKYVALCCSGLSDDSVITITKTAVPEPIVANVLPTALDVDGVSVYNGKGWKEGVRWSSSSNSESPQDGIYMTGYIPVRGGDIIRLKNVTMNKANASNRGCHIHEYRSLTDANESSMDGENIATYMSGVFDDSGNLTQFTVENGNGYTYIRLQGTYIGDDSIISKNKPIE
jgi:hypothetical protein